MKKLLMSMLVLTLVVPMAVMLTACGGNNNNNGNGNGAATYAVTITQPANGTIAATAPSGLNLTAVAVGTQMTFTVTANSGFEVNGSATWNVTKTAGVTTVALPSGTTIVEANGGTLTAPTITTAATLTAGTLGTEYSQQLVATGGGTITWTPRFNLMPPGLTLNSAGLLSGTPTANGSFTFTIRATNDAGHADRIFTLTISSTGAEVAITTENIQGTWVHYNLSTGLRTTQTINQDETFTRSFFNIETDSDHGTPMSGEWFLDLTTNPYPRLGFRPTGLGTQRWEIRFLNSQELRMVFADGVPSMEIWTRVS